MPNFFLSIQFYISSCLCDIQEKCQFQHYTAKLMPTQSFPICDTIKTTIPLQITIVCGYPWFCLSYVFKPSLNYAALWFISDETIGKFHKLLQMTMNTLKHSTNTAWCYQKDEIFQQVLTLHCKYSFISFLFMSFSNCLHSTT